MKKTLVSSIIASSFVLTLQAADTNSFVTHTELGYIQTDGNTQTKTFNLDANAKKEWQKQVLAFRVDAQYASNQNIEIKKRYLFELNYDYKYTKRLSLNYLIGYKSDKYAGFDYQFYTGPGLKYQVLKTKEHDLSINGNILYSSDKYTTNTTKDYTSYRLQAIYAWQMLKNLKFTQELTDRGSFEDAQNYFITSKTAFTSKLSDIFSAGLSYKVDYVNQPVSPKSTDTTLTFNLIMDY